MKNILMAVAFAALVPSCGAGSQGNNEKGMSPDDASKALANSFLAAAKKSDVEASKTHLVMPFWIDGNVLDASSKDWQGEWKKMIGEIGKEEVSEMKSTPWPSEADLGRRAKRTYSFVPPRPSSHYARLEYGSSHSALSNPPPRNRSLGSVD